ncbi:activating signal cointegrator 1 complex subunit, partial [Cystoisospora suis]
MQLVLLLYLSCRFPGFPQKHYCPRMNAMNKPVFDALVTHASPSSISPSKISQDKNDKTTSAEEETHPDQLYVPSSTAPVYQSHDSHPDPNKKSVLSSSSSPAIGSHKPKDEEEEEEGVYSSQFSSSSSFSSSVSLKSRRIRVFSQTALKPSLVFVASRRQTRRTANELIALLHTQQHSSEAGVHSDHFQNGNFFLDVREHEREEFLQIIHSVQDPSLHTTLQHGVAIHHAGLSPHDRAVSAYLFEQGFVRVLVATATLAWGMNLPARLVIVKGTEFYDAETKRYVDFCITDLLQMIGRAGRPQYDTQAVAVILTQQVKKNFYKRFLYQPFPVESCLLSVLSEHLNAEIVNGTIHTKEQAIEYLTWTYFFRRLTSNPSYYDPSLMIQDMASSSQLRSSSSSSTSSSSRRAAIAAFVDSAVCTALDELLAADALKLRMPTPEEITEKEQEKEEDMGTMKMKGGSIGDEGGLLEPILESTPLGRIACMNYISPRTAKKLSDALNPRQGEQDDQSALGGHSCERGSRGRYLTFVDLVRLLSEVDEFKQMPV